MNNIFLILILDIIIKFITVITSKKVNLKLKEKN